MANNQKYAWVTFVNSEQYLISAHILAKSLEISNSKYKLIIFISHDFNIPNTVKNLPNIEYIHVQLLYHTIENQLNWFFIKTKLYIWTLISYDKVCWLDSDMLILKNIDDIFNYDIKNGQIAAGYGCTCNYFKNIKFPTNPDECSFNNSTNIYINSGVILIKPNLETYKYLLDINYDYPLLEQDAFNIVFKNNIIIMDSKYSYLNHFELIHPQYKPDIYIFHFSYGKPWEDMRISDTFKNIYNLWFEYKKLIELNR